MPAMHMNRIWIAAFAFLLLLPALAEEAEPLVTDRPDFVEASMTVGKGVFQFETSVGFESTDHAGPDVDTWTTPTLFKYGLSENWELRLETPGATRRKVGGESDSGLSDIALGAKWHAVDGEPGGAMPSMALLFHVDLETGSNEFSGEGARPSVRAVAEWELGERTALGAMVGAIYENDEGGDRFLGGILGLVVGYSFTERFRGFAEYAAPMVASTDNGGNEATWNTGVAYLISNNWQADTALSFGANDNSPDFFWTIGLSGRFGE
jgi:hypothetical protein